MYKVIAERNDTELFETKWFNTIQEINEYFEGFEMWVCDMLLNIYETGSTQPIGFLQETPSGLIAVNRKEEIL